MKETVESGPTCSVSILILALDEAANLERLLGGVRRTLDRIAADYEIVVLDGGSKDETVAVAERCGARVVRQHQAGYGSAFREGIAACTREYLVTLDADLSHDPRVLADLLAVRRTADLVVASRYVPFGHANMPRPRYALSRILNMAYGFVLDLPVRDISSGYRLYRRAMLEEIGLSSSDFDVLPEVLVKAYALGFRVREIPFHYWPRESGRSHARLWRFGKSYALTLLRLWGLRNSIASADYDYRGFHSRHPVQRYWQRQRYSIVTGFVGEYERGVDVGCGSSVILEALPRVVGVDISLPKLRFLRNHAPRELACGDVRCLPFPDGAFDLFVCSQVIEHIPEDPRIFAEFRRLLRPGGTLVLGTPDYDTVAWNVIEWLYKRLAPGAYGDEHITHYSLRSLRKLLDEHGFDFLALRYVGGGELIIQARKQALAASR